MLALKGHVSDLGSMGQIAGKTAATHHQPQQAWIATEGKSPNYFTYVSPSLRL